MTEDLQNQQNEVDERAIRKSRRNFLLIAGIAFVPLMIAYLLFFYFPQYIPSGTTNKGTLISPPTVIEELELDSGAWTLIVVSPRGCSTECEKALFLSRQIDVGLGKDARRVNRMFVVQEPPQGELALRLAEEYPDVMVRETVPGLQDRLSGLVPEGIDGTILLSDPNGNVLMYYTPLHGGDDLRAALKHLLRLSNIG
jgi:hypothetical protein